MAISVTTSNRIAPPGEDAAVASSSTVPGRSDHRARIVDALFERYRQRLLAFLTRLMSSVHDAEDLVQETYRRLLEVPALDGDEVRVRAFIFRIATNLAYDRFRSRRVRGLQVELDDADLADDGLDPDRIVGIEQCAEVIKQTLGEIRPRTRQVFLMRAAEHLSYEAIARRLGVSTRTVERDIRYVVEVCQQKLKAEK